MRARAVAVLAAMSITARAQKPATAPEPPSELELFDLEKLIDIKVRSATLTEQDISTAPSAISVITEDQIRALNLRTLRDALQLMAGFTGLDTQFGDQLIAVRGISSSANLLVTLDGERLNDFYDGSFLADLPLNNIARIEVIRGPGSALYGTNAFSGVVSLYSRSDDSVDGGAGAELLVNHTASWGARAHLRIARSVGDWRFHAYGDYWETAGPKVLVERDNSVGTAYSLVPGETNDHRRLGVFQLSIKRQGVVTARDSIEIWGAFHYRMHGPYFGPNNVLAPGSSLARNSVMSYLEYHAPLPRGVEFNLRFTFDRRDSENYIQDQPDNYYHETTGNFMIDPGELYPEGKRRSYQYTSYRLAMKPTIVWNLEDPKRVASNSFVVGAELEYSLLSAFSYAQNYKNGLYQGALENYDSLPLTQRNKDRLLVAAFVQDQLEPRRDLRITAGVRLDYFSDFGLAIDPRLALVWRAHPRYFSLRVAYGRAFRAPTFQELYDHTGALFTPAGFPINGNVTLRAETIDTVEAGVESTPIDRIVLRLTAFYNRSSDLIDIDPTYNVAGTHLLNFPGRQVWGLEPEAQLYLDRENYLSANFSYFNSTQLGDGLPGFESNSNLRFVNRALTDLPTLRFNAFLIALPFARLSAPEPLQRLRMSLTYSYVGPTSNNNRTAYEAMNRFERPAWHELSGTLTFPFFTDRLQLIASFAVSINRTIPITLTTAWYDLPSNLANLFLGMRVYF
jgi:iron complex outermembrane receptor protein